ncbi:MAG: CNP1-like family protein [Zoogloeaceae bacterium]|nr:CNP1-like family protein [Zoogloeaceae bacterium]
MRRRANRVFPIAAGFLLLAGGAAGQDMFGEKKYGEYYEEDKQWAEQEEVTPPAYPNEQTLIEFDVGPAARNRHYIDAATLNVGKDGVIRYVIVIKTSGGATNVTYEGIRCDAMTRKAYAFGRGDMTWGNARVSSWQPIVRGSYQAVLFREYFCPGDIPILKGEEGVDALKRGGHPDAK